MVAGVQRKTENEGIVGITIITIHTANAPRASPQIQAFRAIVAKTSSVELRGLDFES